MTDKQTQPQPEDQTLSGIRFNRTLAITHPECYPMVTDKFKERLNTKTPIDNTDITRFMIRQADDIPVVLSTNDIIVKAEELDGYYVVREQEAVDYEVVTMIDQTPTTPAAIILSPVRQLESAATKADEDYKKRVRRHHRIKHAAKSSAKIAAAVTTAAFVWRKTHK